MFPTSAGLSHSVGVVSVGWRVPLPWPTDSKGQEIDRKMNISKEKLKNLFYFAQQILNYRVKYKEIQ